MNKLILSCFVFTLVSGITVAQSVATIKLTGTTKIKPGSTNRVTVNVKNTQGTAIQKYQSDYIVVLMYKGSANAGEAFNKSVILKDPLAPGASRDFDISFTGPLIPGEYNVEAYLKWGNKTVSNIDKATFVVAEDYAVSITPKVTSYAIERGRTRFIDLKFTITNTGNTTWPEGKYSLDFEASSSPSGASATDKKVFDNDPDEMENIELEPGKSFEFNILKFTPPYSEGNYSFRVTVLHDGKVFDAEGNSKTVTLKFSVK